MNICISKYRGKDCKQQRRNIDSYCQPCRAEHNANLAEQAVHAFAKAAGLSDSRGYTDSLDSILTDLLADLMHYCEREEADWGVIISRSHEHYLRELLSDKGGAA